MVGCETVCRAARDEPPFYIDNAVEFPTKNRPQAVPLRGSHLNPAAVHLTFAEACADKRDQL